jgi:hypothetical protein
MLTHADACVLEKAAVVYADVCHAAVVWNVGTLAASEIKVACINGTCGWLVTEHMHLPAIVHQYPGAPHFTAQCTCFNGAKVQIVTERRRCGSVPCHRCSSFVSSYLIPHTVIYVSV